MKDYEIDENPFFQSYRLGCQTGIRFQNSEKLRVIEDLQPNRPVAVVDRQQIFDPAAAVVARGSVTCEKQPSDDTDRL